LKSYLFFIQRVGTKKDLSGFHRIVGHLGGAGSVDDKSAPNNREMTTLKES
jgi:hypothetical protein